MWTYIVRRLLLMIPTLLGVTVVSFCIMQLAPGDPLLDKLGASGTAGASGQTREGFLVQKRDLKLDRPLLLNTRYYTDFSQATRIAAHYRSLTIEQIAAELERMAVGEDDSQLGERLQFLRNLRVDKGRSIPSFDARLNPPQLTAQQLADSNLTAEQWDARSRESRRSLAAAVDGYVMVWCENLGAHGMRPLLDLLESDETPQPLKIGAARALTSMIVNPFSYTLPRQATPEDQRQVRLTWKLIWEREKDRFPAVAAERATKIRNLVSQLGATASRREIFEFIENEFSTPDKLLKSDVPVLADLLLGDCSVADASIAAEGLKLHVTTRIETDLARDASPAQVASVAHNWQEHYKAHHDDYEFSAARKAASFFADTQYAHMLWRLVTFNFGRTTEKTREPVAKLIWDAFLVSAPLMFFSEVFIYGISVPLGLFCAVRRGKVADRGIQLALFLAYSIPPFVAGMLGLLFLCYRKPPIFPSMRLHSDHWEEMSTLRYLMDYAWHATLPVVCMSLASLAGMAMYSRGSLLDVLGQDYIRTARAKGLSGPVVIFKHALRNAMIPLLTLFSSFLPALLGGSILVEQLFNIPGMGRLSFKAIDSRDFPTSMALIYIDAILVMFSILLTDILYVFCDPRISFESQEQSR